ncbi:MAG: hypothetical protein ACKPH1_06680 [Microcystis panniformis]|jgi:hypothetical protein|nr:MULTISPECIES: hypothetical protein [unclassified Microcystis]MCA2816586.1 hypothetical protein [Microcystis sp. M085S1]MCA2854603.1 hypothetical protein [Microcystis sp. M065S1]MCA2627498.1 hypothetical protein [Microcystis sp. M091S2]MCA2645237.1 hypothetical protein [Microcystis sp. M069S2]MCA2661899.1 hypothetical protein [Microcystis sp. M064S2]
MQKPIIKILFCEELSRELRSRSQTAFGIAARVDVARGTIENVNLC